MPFLITYLQNHKQ